MAGAGIDPVIGSLGQIGNVIIGNVFPDKPCIRVDYVQTRKSGTIVKPALAVLNGTTAQTGTDIGGTVHIGSRPFERTEPPGRHELTFGAIKQVESVTLPCYAPEVAAAVLQEPVVPVGANQVSRIDLILQGKYLAAQHIPACKSCRGVKPVKPLA